MSGIVNAPKLSEKEPTPTEAISVSTIQSVLAAFQLENLVLSEEMQKDLEFLKSGLMTPEEHRSYLKRKYGSKE